MEKSWAGTDDDWVAELTVAETSAPDASRGIGDQLQLCPLLLFGEEIAFGGGSETALRADRKILERDKARSLFDAPREVVGGFELRQFRADQAEDDGFSLGHEAQRHECSRAVIVVFEQEAVDFERAEQFLSDRIVAAFGVPMAAIVATAQMDRERDAVAASGAKACVVGFHGVVERSIGIGSHFVANPFAPLRIHVVAVARRVDLNVAHSVAGKLREIGFHNLDDGPKKLRTIFVNGIGDPRFERDRRELRRTRQRDFDFARTVRFQEWKLVSGERTRLSQLLGDDAGHAAHRGSFCLRVAGFPRSRDRVAEIEAIDSIGEIAHEIAATQFPVGAYLEAEFLLVREDAANVCVFEFAEMFRGAGSLYLPRREQIGRA